MRQIAFSIIVLSLSLIANSPLLAQGTWTQVARPNPLGASGCMILLSDGSVIVCGSALQDFSATLTSEWAKLTPDSSGNYVNGTWSFIAPMHVARRDFASNVLPSGKVFVMGGEYASDQPFSGSGEIYDPVANTWTTVAQFPQALFGDDPSMVLSTGKILCGFFGDGIVGGGAPNGFTYLYDPIANTWTQTGTKLLNDQADEEGYTLLPDGSVLSYNIFASPATGAGSAQRYVPSTGTWVATGPVPVPLTGIDLGYEEGPSLLLPDGRVFLVGANNNTVLYTPSTNTWVQGPSFTTGYGSDDATGAMLPNGKVIFTADIHESATVPFPSAPSKLFQFDPVANTITDVTPSGALGQIFASAVGQQFIMLMLPNGHVLMSTGEGALWELTPTGSPNSAWAPTISSITHTSGVNYKLTGTQINGISEGTSFGDDLENSTNYPIVRIKTETGSVFYARTTNWSPGVVASGSRSLSVDFAVPSALPNGVYQVTAIANGIPSATQSLVIAPQTVPSTVIATFTPATKTLVLQGDANANTVTVTYQAGVLKVEGANGTSIGVIGASKKLTVAPSQSFTVSGAISLTSTLGTGNDSIALVGVDATTVTLNFGTGMDNAALTLCSVGTLNVTGYHTGDTLITTSSTITHKPKLP